MDQEVVWNPVTGIHSIGSLLRTRIVDNRTRCVCPGEHWDLRNDFETCPLTSVGCVFNQDDIWANIQVRLTRLSHRFRHIDVMPLYCANCQEPEQPHRLNYNIKNGSCWKPLFNHRFTRQAYNQKYAGFRSVTWHHYELIIQMSSTGPFSKPCLTTICLKSIILTGRIGSSGTS